MEQVDGRRVPALHHIRGMTCNLLFVNVDGSVDVVRTVLVDDTENGVALDRCAAGCGRLSIVQLVANHTKTQ